MSRKIIETTVITTAEDLVNWLSRLDNLPTIHLERLDGSVGIQFSIIEQTLSDGSMIRNIILSQMFDD